MSSRLLSLSALILLLAPNNALALKNSSNYAQNLLYSDANTAGFTVSLRYEQVAVIMASVSIPSREW